MRVNAPIPNYYGAPHVYEEDGRRYFALRSFDYTRKIEISERFYRAFVAEFGSGAQREILLETDD